MPLPLGARLIGISVGYRIESVDYVFLPLTSLQRKSADKWKGLLTEASVEPDKHVTVHPARPNISLLVVNPAPSSGWWPDLADGNVLKEKPMPVLNEHQRDVFFEHITRQHSALTRLSHTGPLNPPSLETHQRKHATQGNRRLRHSSVGASCQ